MQRYAAEPVEGILDRSGVTPELIHQVTHAIARVRVHYLHDHTSTAGLVSRVPLSPL